jgi:diguanylate cyclase (GGDEF)-like protein
VFGLKTSFIPFIVLLAIYLVLFVYGTYINFNVGFRVYVFNAIIIFVMLNALINLQQIRRSKPYINEVMTIALATMIVLTTVRLINFAINGESANEFLQYQLDSFFVVVCGISNVFVIPGLLSIIQSQQSEKLHQLSQIDALTGLKNRRSLIEYASRIWRQSKRDKVWISVFMLDIDFFKQFNDNHGHAYGDVILREVAESLNQVIKRPLDAVSRYGGEEFVLVLYECNYESAMSIAKDIHNSIKALDVYLDVEKTKPLSVSIGYVSLIATDKHDFDMAIVEADTLMYQSKEKQTNKTTGTTIE